MRSFGSYSRFSLLAFLAVGVMALPIACGKNLSNAVTAPAAQAAPTPNPNAGKFWFQTSAYSPFIARDGHSSVTFDNLMWVIGGETISTYALNDVWYSRDGVNWTAAVTDNSTPPSTQFTERLTHSSVVFNNQMWVIGGEGTGGYLNDVWSSPDGTIWTQVLNDTGSPGATQFSRRQGHASLVFNNEMWVIGGYGYSTGHTNDVWSSSDGVTWTQVLANNNSPGSTQFSQRNAQGCLVYNNQMWVIGGIYSNFYNDVWSSSDGKVWTKVLANTSTPGPNQFSQRYAFSAVVYDNLMWVIGGTNGTVDYNDVWYSSNGSTWTKAAADAAFSPRYNFTSLAFNNEMWVIAGTSLSYDNSDVWETP